MSGDAVDFYLSSTPNAKAAQRFLQRARQQYRDQYDYSEMKYVNLTTHVKVISHKHGAFHTSPKNFPAAVKDGLA